MQSEVRIRVNTKIYRILKAIHELEGSYCWFYNIDLNSGKNSFSLNILQLWIM